MTVDDLEVDRIEWEASPRQDPTSRKFFAVQLLLIFSAVALVCGIRRGDQRVLDFLFPAGILLGTLVQNFIASKEYILESDQLVVRQFGYSKALRLSDVGEVDCDYHSAKLSLLRQGIGAPRFRVILPQNETKRAQILARFSPGIASYRRD